MPGKMARSDPRPSVRITRGAGSGQHLASVLQEGRESANIDAGLGFIWRISVEMSRRCHGGGFSSGFSISPTSRPSHSDAVEHMEDVIHRGRS